MQTTIYATFETPYKADEAFLMLLEQGVSLLDMVVITRKAYKDQPLGESDGRLDVAEIGQLEHGCLTAVSTPRDPNDKAEMPTCRNPFEDEIGGIRLLENLAYPGDLTECLKKLGFKEEVARDAETSMLEGAALLIVRVPSGPVGDVQAWEIIERFDGIVLAPIHNSSYLG